MSNLWPSLWSPGRNEIDPFHSAGREMYDMINRIMKQMPSLPAAFDFSAALPALNVAETKDAIEVSAELPGLDEKDINVSVEGNRLILSGERKQDSEKKDQDWHVKETSYGSFRRAVLLPFEPAGDAVEAHLDKGMLHVKVRKPADAAAAKRTIEIKSPAKT